MVKPKSFEHLQKMYDEDGDVSSDNENILDPQTDDETSDFYLM